MREPEGKNKRISNSFTACRHYTYGKIPACNFVDFRSRHACSPDYRRPYLASRPTGSRNWSTLGLFEKNSPGMGFGLDIFQNPHLQGEFVEHLAGGQTINPQSHFEKLGHYHAHPEAEAIGSSASKMKLIESGWHYG